MHFEFLVEGQAERSFLDGGILQQLLGVFKNPHTWAIHKHRGIGELPENILQRPSPKDATLLHNLPSKLRAYGQTQDTVQDAVVVLLDLDTKLLEVFKQQLNQVLETCNPAPTTIFCFAVEELEAWYWGDKFALKEAFPEIDETILASYEQDSIVGTWELLAKALNQFYEKRQPQAMDFKINLAKKVTPYMRVDRNISPSFIEFKHQLLAIKEVSSI